MARRSYHRAGKDAPQGTDGGEAEEIRGTPPATVPRDSKGRWLKGYSANPAGRRPGSRNRISLLAEEMFAERAKAVIETVLRKAIEGDVQCLTLALTRIVPPTRGSFMSLGPLPPLDSIENCDTALEATIQAAAVGKITTEECQLLTGWIKLKIEALAARQLSERVKALEARPIDLEARVLGTGRAA